jgi:hypothetical protein
MMNIMKSDRDRLETVQPGRWHLLDPSMAVIVFLVIILLPFVILSVFSNPQADDFSAAATTQRFGYFKAVASVYNVWNGRWFSTAVMQANPLVFGSIDACKAIPIALLVFFLWALVALIRILFPEYKRTREVWLCALVLLALYLSCMPSVVQGFYWMSGAINYQLANIMMLLLWVQTAKLADTPAKKTGNWILVAILIFATIGSNETTMVLVLFVLGAMLIWCSAQKGRMDRLFAGMLVLAGIAAAIVAAAPGNYVRMAHTAHPIGLAATARESVLAMARVGRDQLTNPLLLIFTGLSISFFAERVRTSRTPRSAWNPVVISGIWIGSMLATIIPAVHLLSGTLDRILNVTILLFIVGWFLIVSETVRYVVLRHSLRIPSIPGFAAAILVLLAFFILAGKSNIREAWSHLLRGTAYRYDSQLRGRYAEIRNCSTDTCAVAPLNTFPRLLYYEDIHAEADYWINKPYAEYFGKKAITLRQGKK